VNSRALLKQLSIGRLVIGGAFIAAPGRASAGWIGADGERGSVHVLARAFGARDAAIGAGTLSALNGGGSLQTWVLAGVAADVTDLAATALAGDRIPALPRAMVLVVAATATAVGAAVLASGDDSASAAT
jgi:hypothetical protein